MHTGRRCSAPQWPVRVFLLLQEPDKFRPSLIHTPAPACASSLGAGSDPQSTRLPVLSYMDGLSPEALHPTPTLHLQPVQPPGLLHVPGAGSSHVWQGCSGASSVPVGVS